MAKQKPIGFRFDYWLWDRLQEKGMTQEQLAQQAGMSPSAITLYLARRRSPTLATLTKILTVLDARLEIFSASEYEKCEVFRIKGKTGDCVGDDDAGEINPRCAKCPCYRRHIGMEITK